MLYAKFQNDSDIEMDVMDGQDFARFEFKIDPPVFLHHNLVIFVKRVAKSYSMISDRCGMRTC